MSEPVPLQLALDPILPMRTAGYGGTFEYGFRLRLPDGPMVRPNDPLLAIYGAIVVTVAADDEDEALQSDTFAPGAVLTLLPEDGCGVGVWDGEGLRRAGVLPDDVEEHCRAALEHGMHHRALVLIEDRAADDGRRQSIDLLIHHPAFVHVDESVAEGYESPAGKARPRLVLVAGGGGEVRWWDPSAGAGPLESDDLPLSDALATAMRRLCDRYAELRDLDDPDLRGFERFEAEMERDSLDGQAAALWRRARAELAHRYAVGFLASGMKHPAWAPSDLEEEDDDDDGIPF